MDAESKLRELERRSAAAGQPVTVQKRAALKALVERRDHPTAETVYGDVARELPHVSKATVYRALDNFVQLGLARRVSMRQVTRLRVYALSYTTHIFGHRRKRHSTCISIWDEL